MMRILMAACHTGCTPDKFVKSVEKIVHKVEPSAQFVCLREEGIIDTGFDLVIHDDCGTGFPFWDEVKSFEDGGGLVVRSRNVEAKVLRARIARAVKTIKRYKSDK